MTRRTILSKIRNQKTEGRRQKAEIRKTSVVCPLSSVLCRLSVLALVMVGLGGSAAFALDPMGPPAAGLKQGQFRTGADYSYSTMDLQLKEGEWVEYLDGAFFNSGEGVSLKLKDFKAKKAYINLGYGIAENWEAFLRLGGTNARFGDSIWEDDEKFDGNADFAIGGGAKATFYQEGNLMLGGLFQASWATFDGQLKAAHWAAADFVEIDITEIQIAVGPTYKLTDGVWIYAGPFLHFIDGHLDDTFVQVDEGTGGLLASKYSWNVEEDSIFGGYIGAHVELTENCLFNVEYQRTAAADALAASFILMFL